MSAEQPPIAETPAGPGLRARRAAALGRWKFVIWGVALLGGVGIGAAIHLANGSGGKTQTSSSTVVQTWGAGEREAPAFALRDQDGKPLTLASFRGRPVIVTFIDPLCRNFCPREASVLSTAVKQLGAAQPAIVSVSVDPWADTAKNFHQDALHWNLAPGWRWGVGTQKQLASVWKDYEVGVLVTKKTIAGITLRNITHTGAAYLIDGTGHERALFLYPFAASDVVDAARTVLGTGA